MRRILQKASDIQNNRDLRTYLIRRLGEMGFACVQLRSFTANARLFFYPKIGEQNEDMAQGGAILLYWKEGKNGGWKLRSLDGVKGKILNAFEVLKEDLAEAKGQLILSYVPYNASPIEGGALNGPFMWYELTSTRTLKQLGFKLDELTYRPVRWYEAVNGISLVRPHVHKKALENAVQSDSGAH